MRDQSVLRASFVFLICCVFISQGFAVPETQSKKFSSNQKITLNLLEPIAPQKHAGEGERVTSNLGEILNDPKNETLRVVKVLGRKKRIQGNSQRVTQIIWEEVALDAVPSREMAAKGIQVPTQNSLKEPVKKPLQSAFQQRSEVIASGTPIEAKGDVEGLLAAARSLLIRAEKQGYKIMPVSVKGLSQSGSSSRPVRREEQKVGQEKGVRLLGQNPEGIRGKDVFDLKSKSSSKSFVGEGVSAPQRGSKQTTDSSFSPKTSQWPSYQSSSYGSYPSSSNGFPPSYSSSGSRGSGFDYGSSSWSGPRGEKKKEDSQPSPVVVNLGDGGSSPSSTPADDKNFRTPKKRETRHEDGERSETESGDEDFEYPFGKRGEEDNLNEVKPPVIKVEYDFDVCVPRIDWQLNQVVLQAKAITFKDGVKITESDCADTTKRFAIQKDYTCDGCEDLVEKETTPTKGNFGFAYAAYRPYWLDEASKRTYLKDPQKDEKHPFALQEEEGKCLYSVDLGAKTAIAQSELVYYNRVKQRVVTEACRPGLGATPLSITATQKGCGIVHDFAQNRSINQQRLIYSIDGVEREVLPCHDVGAWMDHEFDSSVCKPFVNHSLKKQQPFAKRFITTSQGKVYISGCEPYGAQVDLAVDTQVCLAEPFHHDFPGKQSYRMGCYYYDHPLKGREYLTPCQPTSEAFPHKKTLVGYKHDDAKRLSKAKTETSIEVEKQKIVIVPAHVDEKETEVPYAKQGERIESKPYQNKMNDRCYQEQRFKKFTVYQRVDSSDYLEKSDDRVLTTDLCVRSKETRYHQVFVSHFIQTINPDLGALNTFFGEVGVLKQFRGMPFDQHHLDTYFPEKGWLWRTDREMERIKTIYPDSSSPEYSKWEWTGYYKDHSLQACREGGSGPAPSIQGVRWHHSERQY